jgi:hypothetical protein
MSAPRLQPLRVRWTAARRRARLARRADRLTGPAWAGFVEHQSRSVGAVAPKPRRKRFSFRDLRARLREAMQPTRVKELY